MYIYIYNFVFLFHILFHCVCYKILSIVPSAKLLLPLTLPALSWGQKMLLLTGVLSVPLLSFPSKPVAVKSGLWSPSGHNYPHVIATLLLIWINGPQTQVFLFLFYFIFLKILDMYILLYLYLFVFGCIGSFLTLYGLSLVVERVGGSSPVAMQKLLIAMASLVGERKL